MRRFQATEVWDSTSSGSNEEIPSEGRELAWIIEI